MEYEDQPSVSSEVTADKIQEYRTAFAMWDKDGDGGVTLSELGELFKSLGRPLSLTKLQQMFDKMDADGSGIIDFSEFLALMTHKIEDSANVEEIREGLRAFDKNNDSRVHVDHMRHVLMSVGEKLSIEDWETMLTFVEVGEDGTVDMDELAFSLHLGTS